MTLLVFTGCCSTAQRKSGEERGTLEKQAVQEVTRVCALPEPEREAELKKIRAESGMLLYCSE
jgi:predicted amidohydrolase YtcJ